MPERSVRMSQCAATTCVYLPETHEETRVHAITSLLRLPRFTRPRRMPSARRRRKNISLIHPSCETLEVRQLLSGPHASDTSTSSDETQEVSDRDWYLAQREDLYQRYPQYRYGWPSSLYIDLIDGQLEFVSNPVNYPTDGFDTCYVSNGGVGIDVFRLDTIDDRVTVSYRAHTCQRDWTPLRISWSRGPDESQIIETTRVEKRIYPSFRITQSSAAWLYPLSLLGDRPTDATHIVLALEDLHASLELPPAITRLVARNDINIDDVDPDIVWSSEDAEYFAPIVDRINKNESGGANPDGFTVFPILNKESRTVDRIKADWRIRDRITGRIVSEQTAELSTLRHEMPPPSASGGLQITLPEVIGQFEVEIEFTLLDENSRQVGVPQCMTHAVFVTFDEARTDSTPLELRSVRVATRWGHSGTPGSPTDIDVLTTLMGNIYSQGWQYSLLTRGPSAFQTYDQLLFASGDKFAECGGWTRTLIHLAWVHGLELAQHAVHDFLTIPGLVSSDGMTGNAAAYDLASGLPTGDLTGFEGVSNRWFWAQHITAAYESGGRTLYFDTTYDEVWTDESEFVAASPQATVSLFLDLGDFQGWALTNGYVVVKGREPSDAPGERTGLNLYSTNGFDVPLSYRNHQQIDRRRAPAAMVTDSGNHAVQIDWQRLADTTRYEVWIDNLATGERQLLSESSADENSLLIPAGFADGTYAAFVRAIYQDGDRTEWSEELRFSIGESEVPEVPIVTIRDIETEDRTPNLSWDAIDGAAWYEVEVRGIRDRRLQVVSEASLNTTSFAPDRALADGVYRARVRSLNYAGIPSAWSENLDFRVGDFALTPPTINGPGSTTRERRPEISWEPVDGAVSYWLFIVDYQERRWVDSATVEIGTSYRLDRELVPGHYKVIVHAVDANGVYSRLSRHDFTVEGDVPRPDRPIITSPGVVTTERSPRLEWNAVEHAVNYSLRIDNRSTGESNIVQVDELIETSYQVEELLPLGRYRVELLAWNRDGLSSVTNEMLSAVPGQYFEFTVTHPAPPDTPIVPDPETDDGSDATAATNVELIDGVVSINGTDEDDRVSVMMDGAVIIVQFNETESRIDRESVNQIQFTAGAGHDMFVNSTLLPCLVDGQAGNDVLRGGRRDDTLLGGDGDDLIRGGAGNDSIDSGDGDDSVKGGVGNDTLNGSRGNDVLSGGPGRDLIDGEDGTDWIRGGSGHDTLRGGSGNDVVQGGAGHDVVIGGTGNDRLRGGLGNDTLAGNAGDDRIFGQAGNDAVAAGAGHDTIRGNRGDDTLLGGDGHDMMAGDRGADVVLGENDDDVILARHADGDILAGGDGHDHIEAAAGEIDELFSFRADWIALV